MPTPDDLAAVTLPTETNPAHEALAAKLRQASRLTDDSKPEGTRDALERCVKMLDTYGPECFPANEKGQIHFARAMMESVADEITAHLSRVSAPEAEVKRLREAVSPGEIAAINDAAGLCESEANRWENSTDIRGRQTGEHWRKVAGILRGDALAARVNFDLSNELRAERDRLLTELKEQHVAHLDAVRIVAAELAALREAARPFADWVRALDKDGCPDAPPLMVCFDRLIVKGQASVGDLRTLARLTRATNG